jgi:hypothetical protein
MHLSVHRKEYEETIQENLRRVGASVCNSATKYTAKSEDEHEVERESNTDYN